MTGSFSIALEPRLISAGRPAHGRVQVPSSKSLTHRYFNLALLARRPIVIERPLLAEDTRHFLQALEVLGWAVSRGVHDAVELRPGAVSVGAAASVREIFCGNAGTLLRFLLASLAAIPGRWRLDGTPRLRERPVGSLVNAMRRLGAEIQYLGAAGCVPLEVLGGSLRGGESTLDAGESSQYLSALLMASLAAPRPVSLEVTSLTSAPYVDVTLAAIRSFGGRVLTSSGHSGRLTYSVEPGLEAPPAVQVEGDASAACYPAAAAALTGGTVELAGLSRDSVQGDLRFLDLLASMGAEVQWHDDWVTVRGRHLHGLEVDLSAMPDQVPTLAALAPFARGTSRILNVAHLRLKESDRLAAMAGELRRLGAEVEEGKDRLEIAGSWFDAAPPSEAVAVETHGDHRIAMSLALVGLRRPGVMIRAPEVVAKSYPGFWEDFDSLFVER